MIVKPETPITRLVKIHPECIEFLWPFRRLIREELTVEELSVQYELPIESLIFGLTRTVKRAVQYPCNYAAMRKLLVKPDHVNVAGYVNFTWQNAFTEELKTFAKTEGIRLNLNIFPKYRKKEFQNYMALCQSVDDLPEILIGKGFSSFNTQQFTDSWVRTGHYTREIRAAGNDTFKQAGLIDPRHQYHSFGAEEFVMIFDRTMAPGLSLPKSWDDLLNPEYKGLISQMGKNAVDHFGFVMLFYLYQKYGEDGIRNFAGNVKNKQHFSGMVKNMATELPETAPINLMHNFAKYFIRSDARESVKQIDPVDGNPVISHFFLIKKYAGEEAVKMARHFYSRPIGDILERSGSLHAANTSVLSKEKKIRWIGWETVKNAPLPFLKEYLSEVAYSAYRLKCN